LRQRAEIGLDMAGLEIVETERIPLPQATGLKGAVLGDIHTRTGDGTLNVYYMRPEPNRAVPRWLGNVARAGRELSVMVYVVTTQLSSTMEESCRAEGAGLLIIGPDNVLDLIVDPTEIDPQVIKKEFDAKLKDMRHRLERRVSMNVDALKERFERVDQATSGMLPEARDHYIQQINNAIDLWESWGDTLNALLDEAATDAGMEALEVLEEQVKAGAIE
jgi:hypothetical protein